MTERFTMFGSTIRDNGEDITAWDCCDLLNELNDENMRLKGSLERCRNKSKRQSKDLDKYYDYFTKELNWDCDRIIEEVFK